VISEAIMGVVDDIFMTKRPSARGFRHVDDYEMCFDTRSEADQALADLQEALTEFELAINAAKTSIVELPLPIEEPWVSNYGCSDFAPAQELKQRTWSHI
jgi:hypothetical protein